MKNNISEPKKLSGGKAKAITLTILVTLALVGLTLFVFRATDHRRELRMVLLMQDNARLEQLLKAHPGLVEAQLPNRSRSDTWQPLHMAACYGSTEAIEILIKHKAKVNARDSNGLTPLHYTIPLSRYESAQMLIIKGADMNAKGRDGNSPLDLAKNLRDKKMIELFRTLGAKE